MACEEEEYVIAGTAEELEAGAAAEELMTIAAELSFTAAELCSTDAELGKTDAELGKTDAELGKTDAELVPAGTVSVAVALLDAESPTGRTVDAEEAIATLPALAASSESQLTRAAEIPATQKPYRICLSMGGFKVQVQQVSQSI